MMDRVGIFYFFVLPFPEFYTCFTFFQYYLISLLIHEFHLIFISYHSCLGLADQMTTDVEIICLARGRGKYYALFFYGHGSTHTGIVIPGDMY